MVLRFVALVVVDDRVASGIVPTHFFGSYLS